MRNQSLIWKLSPFPVEKIWGGQRLKEMKNLSLPGNIGETWEVSTHPDGPSHVGPFRLSDRLKDKLSYLIKYVQTTQNLSIQVHPDNQQADQLDKASGKDECWYILEAEKGAGIFAGFKTQMNRSRFKKLLASDADLTPLLNFIEIRPGDFIHVPAGLIHAIGKGVTLVEIQENSDVTYRIWDWNRAENRPLHIDKALGVLNFDANFNNPQSFYRPQVKVESEQRPILNHPKFQVYIKRISPGETSQWEWDNKTNRPVSILVLKGQGLISRGSMEIEAMPYDTFFLPIQEITQYQIQAKSEMLVLRTC